jgi:hypothetical protein
MSDAYTSWVPLGEPSRVEPAARGTLALRIVFADMIVILTSLGLSVFLFSRVRKDVIEETSAVDVCLRPYT